MYKLLSFVALTAFGAFTLSPAAAAHGGTYRGPGDIVPPGGFPGGGNGGNPVTPATPGGGSPGNPNSPNGPGPITPGTGPGINPGGGAANTPGIDMTADLTEWSYWWEFNKAGYLNLRDNLRGKVVDTGTADWFLGKNTQKQDLDRRAPRKEDIDQLVVPALLEALHTETHNDIITGCLMALAKIGDKTGEDGSSRFQEEFVAFLSDSNPEIRETAALAIGILGNDSGLDTLKALAMDDPTGRELVGGREVDRRTRTFATFGLGMIARQSAHDVVRADVFATLTGLLDGQSSATRDIEVACINALGLFQMDTIGGTVETEGGGESASLHAQAEYLLGFLRDEGRSDYSRAHCPAALARMFEARGSDLGELWRERILQALLEGVKDRDLDKQVQRGMVLAMGQLADCDSDEVDRASREFLTKGLRNVTDQQTRRFGLVSMAQLVANPAKDDSGLRPVVGEILRQLAGNRNGAREWAAISVGLIGNEAPDELSPDLVHALKMGLEEQRGPRVSAYAIGAGLTGSEEFTEPLLEQLDKIRDDTARGYICVALGMIGDPTAIRTIQEVIADSTYRGALMQQAAVGLGLLGGYESSALLVDTLVASKSLAVKASMANALGLIGDRRSLEPLVALLSTKEQPDLARGLAAAALGNICSGSMLPWNEPLARNINYRAATETLTGLGGRGILDIL
ncbi:MAG: HEAT repeat domain-containing protein [Planctomycetota bacterium]|nr:HEAT repeat domain-containing protein [Planctomycetota bacterium]